MSDYLGLKNISQKCHGSGENYIICMEEKFYNKSDIFIDVKNSYKIKSFYFLIQKGIIHSLQFEKGMIKYDVTKTIGITLNNNLTYEIFIMDPKAQIFSSTPSIIPRSTLKLSNGSSTITEVYFKVEFLEYVIILNADNNFQVIKHEKLNRPDNPCEPDPDYNLGHCVEKSIMRKIGCQLPWRRVNIDGMPICDNSTMLNNYDYSYWWAVDWGIDNLIKLTKCLMPCSFMEYKVQYFYIISDM